MIDKKIYLEKYNDGSIRNELDIHRYLSSLSIGRYVVSISKYKKRRSLSQQGYYFAVVVPSVKDGLIDMGFPPDQLDNEATHELLKAKFLKKDLPNDNGEFVTIVRSTTSLNTYEYSQFLEQIWQWSAEFLNIHVPAPNEQTEMF